MLAFGIGTLPAMLLTGFGAQTLGKLLRRRNVRRAAGVLLLVLGLLTLGQPLAKMLGRDGTPHQHHAPLQQRQLSPPQHGRVSPASAAYADVQATTRGVGANIGSRTMVWARSGPVDTNAMGTPTISAMRSR